MEVTILDKFIDLSNENPTLFLDILESIKDAIFISDHEGKTLWLNSASEAMCGVPKNKIMNRNVKDLEKEGLFNPSVLRITLEEGKNVSTVQTVNKGRKFIATGHLVKNKNGKVIAAVAHLRDITDIVSNASKLQEIEELLEKYSTQIRKLTNTQTNRNTMQQVDFDGKNVNRVIAKNVIDKIAKVDTTALIVGETGTGKNLTAKQIHMLSKRRNGPFVQINCASLPDSLFESELFGYEKGSFTGATSKGKSGLINSAESGTLFLDEIGEMPLHLQTKLLHFLQSKTYMPIGARDSIYSDVRIIAATNKDLEHLVAEGMFRSDLFYRLNILTVSLPPLRECQDDIEDLANYFLNKFNEKYHTNKRLSNEILNSFSQYSWPGNVRELENLIERLVILSERKFIEEKDLPQKMMEPQPTSSASYLSKHSTMPEILEDIEKKMIIDALEKENSTRKAANLLGVTQSLLMRRVKKYNINLIVEESKTFVK